jgi:ubiquitin C-terminal hydrolase
VYSYIVCTQCGFSKQREDYNLDLQAPVKNIDNLNASLDNLFMSYEVICDYKCDECGQKVDIHKHNKIKTLPVILSIPLNRFEYNMIKDEREKINDYFAFPLELDMKNYIDQSEVENNKDTEYELNAVIVHRGTPFSGHFFSYIRDLVGEGNWDLEPLDELKKQPSYVETKSETIEVKDEIDNKDDKIAKSKGQGKNKNKKGKQKMDKEDEEYQKYNYDDYEYPIEYKNKDLSKGWFCFDDTSIFPIRLGRLIKQFKSSESAYVLFYIKKGVQILKCNLSSYLQDCNPL